jgi:hypothetical protein
MIQGMENRIAGQANEKRNDFFCDDFWITEFTCYIGTAGIFEGRTARLAEELAHRER